MYRSYIELVPWFQVTVIVFLALGYLYIVKDMQYKANSVPHIQYIGRTAIVTAKVISMSIVKELEYMGYTVIMRVV